jgi:glyoxylase I family protein
MAEKSRISTIGIHHVSINVTDVEAALAFYLNILELEQLPRPDLGFPGAWIKAGDQEIHLLGIDSGRPLKEQHFAFAVTDADSVHAALTAEGFAPLVNSRHSQHLSTVFYPRPQWQHDRVQPKAVALCRLSRIVQRSSTRILKTSNHELCDTDHICGHMPSHR